MSTALSTAKPDRAAWLSAHPQYTLAPLLLVVLVAGWHLVTASGAVPAYILPKPLDVLRVLLQGLSAPPGNPISLWPHLGITVAESVLGFAIGSIAGIAIGMGLAHSRLAEQVFYPYIIAFQALPKIAIAPFLVVWFGFGIEAKVLITSVITFFPLLVNSMAGYHAVEPDRIDLARACNATRLQIFSKIILPSSLPFIFAGLNMAAVLALLGAIVGEFVGAQSGLGMLLLQYNNNLNMAGAFAILVLLGLIGMAFSQIMRIAEKRFCFWARRPKFNNGQG
jgi:NitT/TauT family transport system permease protein